MATQSPAFFSWQQPLAAFFGGLSAAGQPGGFSNFGAGVNQTMQQQQQAAQQQQVAELRDLQIQQQQEEMRRANQEMAQRDAAGKQIAAMLQGGTPKFVGGAGGGNHFQQGQPAMFGEWTPEQRALVQQNAQVDPYGTLGFLQQQAFAPPQQPKWQMATVREGDQEVTYRIDMNTGNREEISRGPAFAPQQNNSGEAGLVPFYTKDQQGNLHMWQPTKSGRPIEIALPAGQAPAPGMQFLDTGTSFIPTDKRTGAQEAPIAKDVAGAEAQKTVGGAVGQAQVDLSGTLAKADETHAVIDKLRKHPGREYATGKSSVLPLIPGTAGYDFNVALQQAQGGVFLQAYTQLKGAGAITEVEGAKAEQAIARLNRAQSEPEFLAALDDLDNVISAGANRLKKRASGDLSPASSNPPPPPGFVPLTQ